MKKGIILALVIAAIVVVIVLIQNPFKVQTKQGGAIVPAGSGKEIGQIAPGLSFESVDGNEVKISDFKGKVLVANAWAAWCPFCINEMPELQQVSDEFGNKVEVLFVHRTKTESEDIARKYLEDFAAKGTEIKDPVVFDENDDFYRTYFGFGMPVTVFIDENGVIVDRKVGALTVDETREKINAILK